MKFNEIISTRTRELLKARKWTQYQLAQRSAIPLSTLSYVLNNKGENLTTDTLLNICRGFQIRLTDFFNDELFEFENIADDE
jgi:transcriptional regulator with XRE-family HTH domain